MTTAESEMFEFLSFAGLMIQE